jgi:hypothetical protein
MLGRIALLDKFVPGIAGHYLRAGGERRHVIAAYCSQHDHKEELAGETARFLLGATHRTILVAAFGAVPAGLRGALGRVEASHQDPVLYPLLYRLLSELGHPRIPAAIQLLPVISVEKLRIVEALPPALCYPVTIDAIEDARTARGLAKLVRRMVAAGIDEAALVTALRRAPRQKAMEETLYRWSLKLPFPAGPVPPSSHFFPVANGQQLADTALRYRNCMKSMMADVLSGETAFAEFHVGSKGVIVEFRRILGIWYLNDIHAVRNGLVSDELRMAAQDHCRQRGVGPHPAQVSANDDWTLLRRIGHRRQFEF